MLKSVHKIRYVSVVATAIIRDIALMTR